MYLEWYWIVLVLILFVSVLIQRSSKHERDVNHLITEYNKVNNDYLNYKNLYKQEIEDAERKMEEFEKETEEFIEEIKMKVERRVREESYEEIARLKTLLKEEQGEYENLSDMYSAVRDELDAVKKELEENSFSIKDLRSRYLLRSIARK